MEQVINLLIIRTPFQAWFVEQILQEERVEQFDIIYITQNNSEEDRYYYGQLKSKAMNGSYIFVKKQKFDVLNTIFLRIKLRRWYKSGSYNKIIYASITALVPNSLVANFPSSELITFDDGAANIVVSDEYHVESKSRRYLLYRYLLGASPINDIKSRISRHYTLYSDFKNIVDARRLIHLDSWNSKSNTKSNTKNYFIGSPFEEIMNENQILRLKNYVKKLNIDSYVTHPRERKRLDIDVDVLNKQGRIAEDAIISDAGDRPIGLVGWFSTVMLNLGAVCESRIVLLPKDSPKTPELFELSKKAGCTPILI